MRRLALLSCFLALPLAVSAQYGRMDFSLQSAQGQAIAGATVNVYTQPSCGAAAGGLATLYPAATGGTPLTQPLSTDGFGSAFAYAAPGCYTVVYFSQFTGTRIFADQVPATNGASISLSTLGTGGASTLIGSLLNIPQYQSQISLTTTGTSGAATLTGAVINIPQYQCALTLTTTGTSGAATLSGCTLNIPQYAGGSGAVNVNGSMVSNPNFNGSSPAPDANFIANTFKVSASNVIAETPYATGSAFGVIKPDGTSCTVTLGVLTCPGTGGISGLTTGVIPVATSPTAIGNSNLDDGKTTTGTITSTEPIAAPSFKAGSGSAPTNCNGVAGGCITLQEGAGPLTPSAGVDTMRADSINHCIEMSLNGAAEACIGSGGTSGTSVNFNGGSTQTTLAINGITPLACSDTSGSGTTQACTTAPSFTPVANNCVLYTTTTTNSGTGLTVDINSIGAKSVAVPGSSSWTTTLTPGIMPANKPIPLCYDGTNLDAIQTGTTSAGGSGLTAAPPYLTAGGNYFLADGYQVTKPPTTPSWINSVAPGTIATGANGNLLLTTTGSGATYFLTETGSTSVEFEGRAFGTGGSPNFGIWMYDSTNSFIWGLDSSWNGGNLETCIEKYSYSGTGNPSFISNVVCYAANAYGWSDYTHLKLVKVGSTLNFEVSIDGGSSFFTLPTTESVGTLASGGVVFFDASNAFYLNVASLVVN